MWMGAVAKDVMLILYIMSITQVTSRGGIVSPGHSFNSQSVGTKSKVSHAANDIARKIKKHVFGKGVWRMCDRGSPGREGTPLMVSGAFAVVFSWTYVSLRCPIIQVPLPEVHNKATKINGFTLQQPFLE